MIAAGLLPLLVPALLWSTARRPGRGFVVSVLAGLLAGVALAIATPDLVIVDGGPKASIGFSSWVLAASVLVVGGVLAGRRADGRPGSMTLAVCVALSCFIHYAGLWMS